MAVKIRVIKASSCREPVYGILFLCKLQYKYLKAAKIILHYIVFVNRLHFLFDNYKISCIIHFKVKGDYLILWDDCLFLFQPADGLGINRPYTCNFLSCIFTVLYFNKLMQCPGEVIELNC